MDWSAQTHPQACTPMSQVVIWPHPDIWLAKQHFQLACSSMTSIGSQHTYPIHSSSLGKGKQTLSVCRWDKRRQGSTCKEIGSVAHLDMCNTQCQASKSTDIQLPRQQATMSRPLLVWDSTATLLKNRDWSLARRMAAVIKTACMLRQLLLPMNARTSGSRQRLNATWQRYLAAVKTEPRRHSYIAKPTCKGQEGKLKMRWKYSVWKTLRENGVKAIKES